MRLGALGKACKCVNTVQQDGFAKIKNKLFFLRRFHLSALQASETMSHSEATLSSHQPHYIPWIEREIELYKKTI